MTIPKLLSIAGEPLSHSAPQLTGEYAPLAGQLGEGLLELLSERNGFYAFESALHVFPADDSPRLLGLRQWNESTLWRSAFNGLVDGMFFFAEDLVGAQFCFADGAVYKFDPETADREYVGAHLREWAEMIVSDFESLTLWPLARDWQTRHGPLPSGVRLVPKIPFVLGGQFAPDNLFPLEATKAMRYYANLAKQLRDLPDGAQVRLDLVE